MKASELKKALELVKPGLSRKEFMEQGTSVIFRKNSLWTFNDEVAVVCPLDSDIEGAVLADPLYAFVSKIPEDSEVKVETRENELKFSAGRKSAGVRLDSDIKLPLDQELEEPESWSSIPESFVKTLQTVLFSASRFGHLPILTCVHITDKFMETCDEFRLTRCSFKLRIKKPLCVVARHLEGLGKYNPTKMGIKNCWWHFLNAEGVRYCVRIVESTYPNLDKFLQMSGKEIEFPKELANALDWAEVITDPTVHYEQYVTVDFSKNSMTVSGKGPNGWAEEKIRMRYPGDPVSFKAHPNFLREMAKIARNITVGESSLKIEGEGFVHVVSLFDDDEGEKYDEINEGVQCMWGTDC